MLRALFLLTAAISGHAAIAGTENFDGAPAGGRPPGWTCGVTGHGSPIWKIEPDRSAPSKPHVLKQSGSGDFPWCARKDVSIVDGYVEVKFKPLAGRTDQAGGLMWRWKDGDNYYVARANALENNVSFYYTRKGRRHTIKYVDAKVAGNQWHTLRVEFAGAAVNVFLDGKRCISMNDAHISGAGTVGVWTKADSITAFDDFGFGGR